VKVAVCVKHVPSGRLRLEDDRLVRDGPGEINDADKHAVEEALRVTEAHGGEVVVVTMGPAAAAESLRTALAMGADRAVHVCDPAAAGSDLVVTSNVLSLALQREQADLLLFGQQTSDGVGGVVWPAVAERLRLPFVSQVTRLEVDGGLGRVRAGRQTEFGDDVVEAPLPVVVSVSDAINEPRYASLKGQMAAKKKPVDVLTLADLGLAPSDAGAAGSRTSVLSVGPPPARPDARTVTDEGDAARVILDYLVERQLA
jgi:electron transfer flavoprotein beta subunit